MPIVNPSLAHLARLERETPDAKPIVMVNLLRFRERADAGDGKPSELTGKAAYDQYSKAVLPLLFEVGGQVLWQGTARAGFIVPEGESWDEVVLVHYPSRAAFLRMVKSDAYRKVMSHRTAALSDSRLIETQSVRLPRWALAAARRLVRLRGLVRPAIR
jgi:uncharacterized protein (DUF1330 family)